MFKRIALATFVATVLCCNFANAQVSDTQLFTVVVPTTLTITPPTAQTITHDETDDAQSFTTQTWAVFGNPTAGVNVSFETGSAFVHATEATKKADARLTLAVGSETGADFSITTGTDTTDYANSDETATVVATSDGAGSADLDLTVEFITGSYTGLAAGNYTMTVTGTISSN